ncbi:tetratricopeptide repeat protein [Aeribacillus sp. FSL W8-0870]|jgi:tetratricopeptide (TPR) repeat protein|uniref:tetratricopeptide repeat protein n=1 Tax=Aeribacillus sp. FSL W8-0870 TaxID=2954706 RepID=UPI0030D50150
MLKELLQSEFPELMVKLIHCSDGQIVDDLQLCEVAIAIYKLMSEIKPNDPYPLARIAEAYHLRGELREAGHFYQQVLELDPPSSLTNKEEEKVMKYAPILYTTEKECFDLLDVVAIHHPSKPLIAYHLFWEDDYDYPDDYEPCDHEQIWVEYDEETEEVLKVSSFVHGRIITTQESADEANANNGRPLIRIEWGKHASLLKGWESLKDPQTGRTIRDMLRETYEHVKQGGRIPDHPLKRLWPNGFDGTWEDYTNFSIVIDTQDFLKKKRFMAQSYWSNAVIQQYFLRYNFHPKYDWPFETK